MDDLVINRQSLSLNVFDDVVVGMAIVTEPGKIIKVNSSFSRLLGYDQEELLNLTFQDITHPHDLQEYLVETEKLIIGEINSFQVEKRFIHKNGKIVWGLLTVSSIKKENRLMKLLLAQIIDITAYKIIENKLLELESFYNLSSEGVVIVDFSNKIIQVNHAIEEMFGYQEEELIGKWSPITPDLTINEQDLICSEIKEVHPFKVLETIIQRKDGQFITVSMAISPIRDEHDQMYALAAIVRDITERKAVVNRLEEFINQNLDPMVIYDHEGKLERVNRAFEETFGWKTDELLGLPLAKTPILSGERKQEAEKFIKSVKTNQVIKGIETYGKRKDGSFIDILLTRLVVRNSHNDVDYFVVTYKDISKDKEVERLLINSDKVSIVGQLGASIAHEIRNPITVIKGFMKLVKQGSKNFIEDIYPIIEAEINRIETISGELLLLGKPISKEFKKLNICKLLRDVCILMQPQANMENIIFNFEDIIDPIYCECNEQQIKQVFMNIIKNAIEATNEVGTVSVSVHSSNGYATIEIIDNGRGIPNEIKRKLGQPFYTTKEKGTGLGLMVSYNIIEQHNGKLDFFSEKDKGTSFIIKLPLINDTL